MKINTMAWWIFESSSEQRFHKLDATTLCKKSGAILLGLVAGWQSDKFSTDRIIRIFMEFNKGSALL